MTEATEISGPDLHLPEGYLARASSAVANLYREDQKISGDPLDPENIAKQKQRDRVWKETGETNFPLLANQIWGLRRVLSKYSEGLAHLSPAQQFAHTMRFTRSLFFEHQETQSFLRELFLKRTCGIEKRDGYTQDALIQEEADRMRGELRFQEGVGLCRLTLDQAIGLVLSGVVDTVYRPPLARVS